MRLRILLIFLLVGTEDFSKVVKNVRGSLCDMSIIKFILGVVFLLILQSLDNRLAISGVQKIVCDVRDAFHAFVVVVLIGVVIESQAVEFGSNIEESFAGTDSTSFVHFRTGASAWVVVLVIILYSFCLQTKRRASQNSGSPLICRL